MHTIDRKPSKARTNIIYFDLETQKTAQEVGGWAHIDRMKLAVAVTFSTADQAYRTFLESTRPGLGAVSGGLSQELPHYQPGNDVEALINQLTTADRIVGFNLKDFDYLVLRPYTSVNLWRLPTFDMLEHIHRSLGFRVSLDALARATLRESKSTAPAMPNNVKGGLSQSLTDNQPGISGLQAVRWWKAGRVDLVARYCRRDVEITKRLHEYACQNGHLLFPGHYGCTRRVNTTDW